MRNMALRPAGRKTSVRMAAVCAAGVALVVGAAGAGQAAASTVADGTGSATPQCGAAHAQASGPGTGSQGMGAQGAGGSADAPSAISGQAVATRQPLAFELPRQAPIGLWTDADLTLRAPAPKGTVRLDVKSAGFSTDSLEVQRYVPQTRQWVDVQSAPNGASWPHTATFSFPLSTAAGAAHPYSVALRFQDVDRPGTFSVAASVADGRGHVYLAPTRSAATTRPAVSVSGWAPHTVLARGGAARSFTVTVKNTTDRSYPALDAGYFLYGAGRNHTLLASNVALQEFQPGRGWVRVKVLPDGCDPGLNASLPNAQQGALEPGASAVYRLRIAVAGSAPADVTSVDAGVSVGTGSNPLFWQDLPFSIAGK
jgi:hypothetical protein